MAETKKRSVGKLSKEKRDEIDELANKLYDSYNPDQYNVINVSKADCIKEVMQRLGYTKRSKAKKRSKR